MSPASPQTVAWEDLGDSSVPLSSNRVQAGRSQDVLDEGSLFHVPPVSPGFLMRPPEPLGSIWRTGCCCRRRWTILVTQFLVTRLHMHNVNRFRGPMSLPVYTLPSELANMLGQSSVQTALPSGTSSRPEVWSSATGQRVDIAREGPFDVFASPMDTEDSPLSTMGLPGCPYRFTSYSGTAISDLNPAFGLQLHHPRFLEFVIAPESARLLYRSPTFWVDQLGEEQAMPAAVSLQQDAGIVLSNLQILSPDVDIPRTSSNPGEKSAGEPGYGSVLGFSQVDSA